MTMGWFVTKSRDIGLDTKLIMSNFAIASLILLKILIYSTQCVSDKSYLRKCVDFDCKGELWTNVS